MICDFLTDRLHICVEMLITWISDDGSFRVVQVEVKAGAEVVNIGNQF